MSNTMLEALEYRKSLSMKIISGKISGDIGPISQALTDQQPREALHRLNSLSLNKPDLVVSLFMAPGESEHETITNPQFDYFLSILGSDGVRVVLNHTLREDEFFIQPSHAESRGRLIDLIRRAPEILGEDRITDVKNYAPYRLARILASSEIKTSEASNLFEALLEKWQVTENQLGIQDFSRREASYQESLWRSKLLSSLSDVERWLRVEHILSNGGLYQLKKPEDYDGILTTLLQLCNEPMPTSFSKEVTPAHPLIMLRLNERLGDYVDHFMPHVKKTASVALKAFGSRMSKSGRSAIAEKLASFIPSLSKSQVQTERLRPLIEILLIKLANGTQENMPPLSIETCFNSAKDVVSWPNVIRGLSPSGKHALRKALPDHSYYIEYMDGHDHADILRDDLGL